MALSLARLLQPLEYTQEEDAHLQKKGFFIDEIDIPKGLFFRWLMYRMNLWIIFIPLLLTYFLSPISFLPLWSIFMMIGTPFLYGAYKVYMSLSKYFLYKYAYITRKADNYLTNGNYDLLLVWGSTRPVEWESDIHMLLAKDIEWFMHPSKKAKFPLLDVALLNLFVFGVLGFFLLQSPIITTSLVLVCLGVFALQRRTYLYAFGSYAIEIQKMTSEFEEQSKQIQEQFQKEMNFALLHDAFDRLSRLFQKILSLVLKLEKREKTAGKGNLFDAERYITSLKAEILSSLVWLREFLHVQNQKLLTAQDELQKVKVGAPHQGVSELMSKDSSEISELLTKNIETLDKMIAKLW